MNITVLEAEAYLATIEGAMRFEKTQWAACIQKFSIARIIYASLYQHSNADLFGGPLCSTVDVSMRYAAYRLKLPRTQAVSDIAIENFPQERSGLREEIQAVEATAFTGSGAAKGFDGSDKPSTVTWRGRTVRIEDAVIAQAIALADKKEEELLASVAVSNRKARKLAEAYDDVINARQEAADATKSALDDMTAEGVDAGDRRVQSLQVIRTAVNYAVIELRIGRNRVLCGPRDGTVFDRPPRKITMTSGENRIHALKAQRPGPSVGVLSERAILCDSVLRDLETIKELPGVPSDTALMEELSSKQAYFRALK